MEFDHSNKKRKDYDYGLTLVFSSCTLPKFYIFFLQKAVAEHFT